MAISAQHTRFVTNDYVNALPAEDFIKVALKKQEMYDEGRKQIKQHLDSYGKMRNMILTDDERNYFDQELNKMVKNVQQNAGLDFSNMNNVEAVINLGKPFENDEYIKGALDWGLEAQNRAKLLESLPADQRSPDNDLVFMHDINEHREQGGLGKKVQKGKTYTQYIDVREKVSKIEKDVQAEMKTIYKQGPAGYIEQVEIESKTREEIKRRIEETLTPQERNQIQIHAQAEMFRMGNDVVYQTWVGDNKQKKLIYEDTKKKAMVERSRLQGLKTKTAQDIDDLNRLDSIIQESDTYITAVNENIKMNPDDFDMGEYVPFFTSRFINGIAGNLVVNKVKSDLKKDEVYMATLNHKNDLAKIQATGQQSRLTAQFEFQQENFAPSQNVSIHTLKNINRVLPKGFKLDLTKKGSEQINQVMEALNKTNISASLKEQYRRSLVNLKGVYETYEENPASQDMIVFNRSQGLGQVQSSAADFLTMPVTDVFSSGLTLEALKYKPSTKGASKSANDKAKETYDEAYALAKLDPKVTDAEAHTKAMAKVNRILEGSTTLVVNPFAPKTSGKP